MREPCREHLGPSLIGVYALHNRPPLVSWCASSTRSRSSQAVHRLLLVPILDSTLHDAEDPFDEDALTLDWEPAY